MYFMYFILTVSWKSSTVNCGNPSSTKLSLLLAAKSRNLIKKQEKEVLINQQKTLQSEGYDLYFFL